MTEAMCYNLLKCKRSMSQMFIELFSKDLFYAGIVLNLPY